MNRLGLRLALTAVMMIAAVQACSSGPPGLIGDQDGTPFETGPGLTCGASPEVGCPCTSPGATAACGEVVRKSGDYVTCSEGQTTCTDGKWGACVGDQTYMKSLGATTIGNVYGQGLQTSPSGCTNDPCDPSCQGYNDNGSGLDAGAGLTPTDAGGITLTQVDGSSCVNLQCQQVVCGGSATTSISGRVVAGTLPTYGSPDPIPNVLVYVPNAALSAFAPGVQCDTSCNAEVSGSPIAATLTNYDGTFTLNNVPVGTNIPVVIQLGRWRREVQFNITSSCVNTVVGDIRMPRNKTDSTPASAANIPFTAISSGSVDALECVLLKMGIDAAEFTDPGGGGRVEFYDGNGSAVDWATPNEGSLTSSLTTLKQYDQILFPCWGGEYIKNSTYQNNLVNYTNVGGHVFATHYSYTWLFNVAPFQSTANWAANTNSWNSLTGRIDTSFVKGSQLAQWMQLLGALDISTTPPEFTITNPREDFTGVVAPSVRWIYYAGGSNFPLHYTFDTPWGATNTCGRVVYSDFHVAGNGGYWFPSQASSECGGGAMTAQEKLLEFLIFDLSSCGTTTPPVVKPYPNPATFTVDYQGICPAGQSVVWRFFDWQTVTPLDSNIVFSAQEATSEAALTGAMPVAMLGTASGAPITTWTGTDVSTLITPSLNWLRVTITLNPSSDETQAPTLTAWRQQFDCVDSQ